MILIWQNYSGPFSNVITAPWEQNKRTQATRYHILHHHLTSRRQSTWLAGNEISPLPDAQGLRSCLVHLYIWISNFSISLREVIEAVASDLMGPTEALPRKAVSIPPLVSWTDYECESIPPSFSRINNISSYTYLDRKGA